MKARPAERHRARRLARLALLEPRLVHHRRLRPIGRPPARPPAAPRAPVAPAARTAAPAARGPGYSAAPYCASVSGYASSAAPYCASVSGYASSAAYCADVSGCASSAAPYCASVSGTHRRPRHTGRQCLDTRRRQRRTGRQCLDTRRRRTVLVVGIWIRVVGSTMLCVRIRVCRRPLLRPRSAAVVCVFVGAVQRVAPPATSAWSSAASSASSSSSWSSSDITWATRAPRLGAGDAATGHVQRVADERLSLLGVSCRPVNSNF